MENRAGKESSTDRLHDSTLSPSATQPVAGLSPEMAGNPQYEILRELGRGGMGVVYLARNKLLGRMEVLKVANKSLLERPGVAERFLREMQSAALLNHPNVVTAYSAVQLAGSLAFAMEYVDGEDLHKVVKARGPLPVANACHYAREAALGLQHAYEKKMVHRDIKPQNLMLARDGKKHAVKVLDFGLAKVMRENENDSALTGTGMMMGTPDYMAPEQMKDAAHADIRADIYSLGCTLYYLLTGGPPFKAGNLYQLLHAHQAAQPKPLTASRPEVPAGLAAVVSRMMAKDPAQRYQTPLEVAQALVPFIKTVAVPGAANTAPDRAAPPTVVRGPMTAKATVISPVGKPKKAAPLMWLWLPAVGLVLMLLLAGGLVLFTVGVFWAKSSGTGILVVEVDEPDADIYVDGDKMSPRWSHGGKRAELRIKSGTHKVEVKKDGFAAFSEVADLQDGKEFVLRAQVVRPGGEPVRPAADSAAYAYASTGGTHIVHFGPGAPHALTFLHDDLRKQYSVRVFDLASGRPLTPPMFHGGRLTHITFSPDGRRVLTSGQENVVRVWDASTGKPVARLVGHADWVKSGVFSPDGRRVVTAGEDKTARVWDAETGASLHGPLRHDDVVSQATFSPDGRRVLTGSLDGTARLWDADSGKELARIAHGSAVNRVAFSPDGRRVVTGGVDGTARVWDAATGEGVSRPIKHADKVKFVAFSPDGRRVATASADTTARVWDAATGEPVTLPLTHAKEVNGVAFSPDGRRVVTASADHTARVWDAATGKPASQPLTCEGYIPYAAFSPDGLRVAAIAADATARAWDAETSKEVQHAPEAIATWAIRIRNDAPVNHKLLANGRVDLANSPNSWEVKGHNLTFHWPQANAPGGVWVDKCVLSADRKSYTATNQSGIPSSGVKVRGDDLPDEPPKP
jgi:WD40 repeat protein